ncbi:hypothetical protein GWK08_17510 [Leptobacterium flavescens]|uniref:Uncharacterized protein n=1 Tax=Leptobacterium flavescens TaxID=472055 RepID=A0A6P0UTC7_9FLAO|nr:hypothetical protein [Leptobacterium flavescens]NER15258.1 hypothetical protein [Leptobacterium flavescens]
MLQDILKLKGVTELGKKQQGKVNGGFGCAIFCIDDSDCGDCGPTYRCTPGGGICQQVH